jgi:nicotinamide riboside kinase
MVKIGLCGTHSSGKTTLLNMLKEEFKTVNLVSEAARKCPFPINEKTGFKSQEWIFREQVRQELNAPLNEITISDRTVYDQLAYIMYAYELGNITHEEYEVLQRYISAWGWTYDYIIYLPIEFPLVEDGIRSTSEDYRRIIDDKIQLILMDYDKDKIATVTGRPKERVEKIKDVLLKLTREGVI